MKRKIIILTTCIILPVLIIVIYFHENNYFMFNGHKLKFPGSDSTKTIFNNGGIDITTFQIMEYNNEDIKEIIKQDFKKINIEKINEIYEKAIIGELFKYLNEDDKEAFLKNFDKEKLFNTNNYYLFYEDTEKLIYEFVLFIIDIKENKLYYILSA